MSYYCLISGDLSKEAFQVFRKRISEQRWPLYEKTKHIDNIKINDLLIFYIGGKYSHCQSFAGEALVSKIEGLNEITIDPDSKNKIVKKYLFLKEIQTFKKPIKILDLIENLDFIKNKKYYGLSLLEGTAEISSKDYDTIISQKID